MTRAKPAATVIMTKGTAVGMPIMAVEQFGKGRTMGFASDVTFFWGTFHNRAWGPPESAVPVVPNTASGDARTTPAPFYNNAYFRRFWIHAMHWLAEGSLRAHGSDFTAGTPLVTWTTGASLPVHASCGDESLLTKLAGGVCTAEVTGIRSTRTRLRFDSRAGRFEGFLPHPGELPAECEVVVEAPAPGDSGKRRATFKVRSPAADVELAGPVAKPEALEPLAAITGGRVLYSAADTVAWLSERRAQLAASGNLARTPAWDHAWILAGVLGLLSVEWLIRRLYS